MKDNKYYVFSLLDNTFTPKEWEAIFRTARIKEEKRARLTRLAVLILCYTLQIASFGYLATAIMRILKQ